MSFEFTRRVARWNTLDNIASVCGKVALAGALVLCACSRPSRPPTYLGGTSLLVECGDLGECQQQMHDACSDGYKVVEVVTWARSKKRMHFQCGEEGGPDGADER